MKQTPQTAPTQSRTVQLGSKNSLKIPTIRSQVLGLIKRPFKASNQPKHYKTLKQSVTSSRIKPLPHGVCQNSSKPEPTRRPRCLERLSFLSRQISTVRSPENLEIRCSLSKKNSKTLTCYSLSVSVQSLYTILSSPF